MKRATLKQRFVADLLTRFVGVYIRLGSPDFTSETIDRYLMDIEGAA
jgi:hypothetical protein